MKTKLAANAATALAAAAAIALAAGIAGSAIASNDEDHRDGSSPGVVGPSELPGSALSVEEILARLEEQGYDEVHDIERDHGLYEVKARDQDGRRIEAHVDPRTGDVLRRKHDD